MPPVYYHLDGRPSPHPTSLESARELRKSRYDDGHKCESCGVTSIKYTATQTCIHCARLRAIDFYNLAVLAIDIPPDRMWTDPELTAALEDFDELPFYPNTPAKAVADKLPGYVRVEACSKAGHVGLRTLDGQCYICTMKAKRGSARQRALAAGEAWYLPDEPCSRCGQRAERRVNNGECSGCVPRKRRDSDETPAQVLMREQPDMVLSRDDARALGLPVYRTGQPCKRDHTGFRYTSTGGCVECVAILAGRTQ